MNSSVSHFGSNSKNTPRLRLQEYNTKYALRISLHRGSAKSTPIKLKGVSPSVLSLGRGSGGRFAKATASKRLQPLQFLTTHFVNFLRQGIRYLSLTLPHGV